MFTTLLYFTPLFIVYMIIWWMAIEDARLGDGFGTNWILGHFWLMIIGLTIIGIIRII